MFRELHCTHCDTNFEIEDRPGRKDVFCPGCGAMLRVNREDRSLAKVQRQACPTCGEPLVPGSDRCGICGENLQEAATTHRLEMMPANSQVWLIWFLAVVPLLSVFLCCPLPVFICSPVAAILAYQNARAITRSGAPRSQWWWNLAGGVIAGLEVVGTLLVFGAYLVNIFLDHI